MKSRLLVVALSARQLAQDACRSGFAVIAADLFGDLDTRSAAEAWHGCGEDGRLRIDAERLLGVIDGVAARGDCAGWVAGSGFEGQPALLRQAAQRLPLWGNPADTVASVRDPGTFFACLARLGITFPEVRRDRPEGRGWLRKDFGGCGGWHIRRLSSRSPSAPAASGQIYHQREAGGAPMSALFIANGADARLLGVSRQIVRPLAGRPWVYHGCIASAASPPALRPRLQQMVAALTAEFGLRGINGLDFLLEGEQILVLELNPRPVASIAVHADVLAGGLLRAHVRAAAEGILPAPEALRPPLRLSGQQTVFAARAGRVGDPLCAALERLPWCHDRPGAGTRFAAGDPVCSVSAEGPDEATVELLLDQRRAQIRQHMEPSHGEHCG